MRINKIIQVYNTCRGENYKVGFNTYYDLIDFWNMSIKKHSENYDEILIYTDKFGKSKLDNDLIITDKVKIIVLDFEKVDSRYWNYCKLEVQSLQDKSFIMVDVDACLMDKCYCNTDVICEFIRPAISNPDYNYFSIESKYVFIPASGILGFTDIEFCKKRAVEAMNKIKERRKDYVTYDTLWVIEEADLAQRIDKECKSTSELNIKYIHLRDRQK